MALFDSNCARIATSIIIANEEGQFKLSAVVMEVAIIA